MHKLSEKIKILPDAKHGFAMLRQTGSVKI